MKLFRPVALAAAVVAAVVLAWLLWPQKPRPSTVSPSKPVVQQGAQLIINGNKVESTGVAAQSSEMRSTLPEHIKLSMIQGIRQENGRKVLVFSDQSKLELTPYLISQLPAEVRLRIEYSRGQK